MSDQKLETRPRTRDVLDITRRSRWRSVVDFDELTAAKLSPQQRAVLVRDWQHRMEQEYLAVRVFAMLADQLAAQRAGDAVLSLVARAVSDEMAHADLCRRLANAFAKEPRLPAGAPLPRNVPQHPQATPRVRSYLQMVEMCCIGETLTTCFFTEAVSRAKSAPMRAALTLLLKDEVDHGRAGWAYLASADSAVRKSIARALPSMLDRTVGWLPAAARARHAGDPRLETYGYLSPPSVIEVYRRGLRDVVLVGLATAGVDTALALAHAAKVGILDRGAPVSRGGTMAGTS